MNKEKLLKEFDEWYKVQDEMNPYILRNWWLNKMEEQLLGYETMIAGQNIMIKSLQDSLSSQGTPIIKMVEGMMYTPLETAHKGSEFSTPRDYRYQGYNQALTDLINKLKE